VIERDAISLLWLQRMPLPRLALDDCGPELTAHLERAGEGAGTTHFFDATTDVGVPTIYSVDTLPGHPDVATLVMCATDLDPQRAAAKVLREAASSRIALESRRPATEDLDDFMNVFDGALYMGRQERRAAFDFLLETPHRRRLSELPVLETGDPARNLRAVLDRLAARGLEAFAVDLTTDEALAVGFRVVRVIVPGLQPLSFSFRARFLAHPRLYEAPSRMGHPVHPEAEITPWPQPFA
jgi:ribosomal protein S12 methylthiotransferase accessory factor